MRIPTLIGREPSYYQDLGSGRGRDCALRYEIIRSALPTERPLSILDVGSNMGYFSSRLAEDVPSLVYSFERNRPDLKAHAAALAAAGVRNNYLFRVALDREGAARLHAAPEVFDVTLLLSVVHHFDYPFDQWAQMVAGFFASSRLTIVELPSLDDLDDIAHISRFRSWYEEGPGGDARDGPTPYEALLVAALRSAAVVGCTVRTLRAALGHNASKERRHLLAVDNPGVGDDLPRHHFRSLIGVGGICSFQPRYPPLGSIWNDLSIAAEDFRVRAGNRLRAWRRMTGRDHD